MTREDELIRRLNDALKMIAEKNARIDRLEGEAALLPVIDAAERWRMATSGCDEEEEGALVEALDQMHDAECAAKRETDNTKHSEWQHEQPRYE